MLGDIHGTTSPSWATGTARCSDGTRRSSRRRRHRGSTRATLRRRCTTRRARPRQAIGYVGAGTVEFLVRPGDAVLVPRDEHPAPGRAPGDRVRHRRRPGAAAARGRRGRDHPRRGPPARPAHASRCGSTRRTPPQTGSRRADGSPASRSPAPPPRSGVPAPRPAAGRRVRGGRRGRHPLRRDAGEGGLLGADRDAALRRLAAALAVREIHGVRTNRDLLVEVLRHPAFVGERAVHRLPRAARPRRPGTPAGRRRHARRRPSPPRWCSPSRRGRRRSVQRGIPGRLAQRRLAAPAHRLRGRTEVEWMRPPAPASRAAASVAELSDGEVAVAASASDTSAGTTLPRVRRRERGRRRVVPGARVADPPRDSWTPPTRSRAARCSRRCPGPSYVSTCGGRARHRRRPGARPGGHEDAAHHHRPARRHGHRPPRRGRARRSRPATVLAVVSTDEARGEPHDGADRVHRDRRAAEPAPGGGQAGRRLRPGVLRRQARSGGKTTELWLRHGQARLPRRRAARGVRRRRWRHRRPRGGVRGARGPGLPAADDGRLARRSAAR